jgi:hypothetical protein
LPSISQKRRKLFLQIPVELPPPWGDLWCPQVSELRKKRLIKFIATFLTMRLARQ